MDKLIILENIEYYIDILVKDVAKLERGERPDLNCERAYYLKGLEQGLMFADTDKLTTLMSDICRYVYSSYDCLQEMDDHRAIFCFKRNIMSLYLMAQSLIKDLGDMEEEEDRIDKLFSSVFSHTQ